MGKHLNACGNLDLDPTMPSIKLARVIFIYNNVFKFHVTRLISFELSCKQKHIRTHEYSIVRFAKRNYKIHGFAVT